MSQVEKENVTSQLNREVVTTKANQLKKNATPSQIPKVSTKPRSSVPNSAPLQDSKAKNQAPRQSTNSTTPAVQCTPSDSELSYEERFKAWKAKKDSEKKVSGRPLASRSSISVSNSKRENLSEKSGRNFPVQLLREKMSLINSMEGSVSEKREEMIKLKRNPELFGVEKIEEYWLERARFEEKFGGLHHVAELLQETRTFVVAPSEKLMEEFKAILQRCEDKSKATSTPSRFVDGDESCFVSPASDRGETLDDLEIYLETPLPSRVPSATPSSVFHSDFSSHSSSLRDFVIKLSDLMVDEEKIEKVNEKVEEMNEKVAENEEVSVEREEVGEEEERVEIEDPQVVEREVVAVPEVIEEVEHETVEAVQETVQGTEREEVEEMQLDNQQSNAEVEPKSENEIERESEEVFVENQEIVQETEEKEEVNQEETAEEKEEEEEEVEIEGEDSFFNDEEEEEGLEEMEEEERRIEEESKISFTPIHRARKSILDAVAPLTPSSARRKPERIFVPVGEVSPVAIPPRNDYTPVKKSPIQFNDQEIVPKPEDDEELARVAEEEISRTLQRIRLEEPPKPSTPLRLTLLKTPQRAQRIPNPNSPAHVESFKTPMARSTVKKEPVINFEEMVVTPLRFADVATPGRDRFYTPKEEEEDNSYYQDAVQDEVVVKQEFHTSRRSREQETPLGLVYGLEEKRKIKMEDDEVIVVTPVRRSTRINNLTADRIKFSAQRDRLQFEPNKRIPEKTDIRSVMNFELIEDSDEEN